MNSFEVGNEMEPLVELPVEKWRVLQEKLKRLWPLNVAGYYSLHVNLKNPELRDAFQFKVYCPWGDMDDGFVAINVKPNGVQECILFSTSQDTRKLSRALANTKLIDWTRKVCIDCVSSIILHCLNNIKGNMNFLIYDVGMVETFFLGCNTKPFEDLRSPNNTYVAACKAEHLPHIDEVWPFKYPESIHYFSVFASNGMTYGLYSGDKLVAWVFLNEYNFLCHLYCEEEHRRNGFAEYIVKFVVNEQLEEGSDVYAYVCEGNEKSVGLFVKLGFVNIDRGAWVTVQK